MTEVGRGDQGAQADRRGGDSRCGQGRHGLEPRAFAKRAPTQVVVGVSGVETEILGPQPLAPSFPPTFVGRMTVLILMAGWQSQEGTGSPSFDPNGQRHDVSDPRTDSGRSCWLEASSTTR